MTRTTARRRLSAGWPLIMLALLCCVCSAPAARGQEAAARGDLPGHERLLSPAETGTADAPPAAPGISIAPLRLFDGGDKQMEMIRARIFSRKGKVAESLALYRRLRIRYPDDQEVWEDQIETLVDHEMYDAASAAIAELLQRFPESLRGRRILTRLYYETGSYRRAFPVYEQILHRYLRDAGVWSDYAGVRQAAGDWADALGYYCRVIELNPNNQAARRAVHAILREHRPRLTTGHRRYHLSAGDADVISTTARYRRDLSQALSFGVAVERVQVDRPAAPFVLPLDTGFDAGEADLRLRLNPQWAVHLTAGGYDGMGDGTTGRGTLTWSVTPRLDLTAGRQLHQPWYDPVDAAEYDGYYHRTDLSLDWHPGNGWGVYAAAGRWDYRLDHSGAYGDRDTLSVIITRQVLQRPQFYLNYQFFLSDFDYADPVFRPVGMLERERVHGIGAYLSHDLCTYWTVSLSGGFQTDLDRAVNSWYLAPELRVRLGNRITLHCQYQYASDSGTADGGDSATLRIMGEVVF